MADQTNLNQKINELSTQLDATETTERTAPVVTELQSQVRPLVEQPDLEPIHYHSLGERLNLALVDLDVDHPRLSLAIQNVLDELAAVGI